MLKSGDCLCVCVCVGGGRGLRLLEVERTLCQQSTPVNCASSGTSTTLVEGVVVVAARTILKYAAKLCYDL